MTQSMPCSDAARPTIAITCVAGGRLEAALDQFVIDDRVQAIARRRRRDGGLKTAHGEAITIKRLLHGEPRGEEQRA